MFKFVVIAAFAVILSQGLTPAANFQISSVLGVNLNAVAYNNVNDTWASQCLGFYFTQSGNQISMNTTLWANPTPENFTLTVDGSDDAIWELTSDDVYWVYADNVNQVYGFTDSGNMVGYVLSPNWNVSDIWIIKAIAGMILNGVPISATDMSFAPSSCASYP